MPIDIATGLIAFQQPLWLLAIPFALLPIVNEILKPIPIRPIQAGWGITSQHPWFRIAPHRLVWPLWISLGAISLVLALASPPWPILKSFEQKRPGHRWAVVLDCSGSMSQVDDGQTQNRLKRLTAALETAIKNRPYDQFSIIRVAGYADRIGPSTSNHAFLIDLLHQIRPALPGEDGTSLGDGLILAADSLQFANTLNPQPSQSILILSDGLENRPDPSAKPLSEVVPLLLKLNVQVDWLRINLPEKHSLTPESQSRGEQSQNLLETLSNLSGGRILALSPNSDWSTITSAAVSPLARTNSSPFDFPSSALPYLFLAFLIWLISWLASLISILISRTKTTFSSPLPLIIETISLSLLATGLSLINSQQPLKPNSNQNPQTDHTLILIDTSPSMSAIDTAHGARLETAKRLTHGFLQQSSLLNNRQVALVAFSGRALGMSPWTNDWPALKEIVDDLESNRISPSGSNWEIAFQTVLELYFQVEQIHRESELNIIMITDGEASEPLHPDTIHLLNQRGIHVHVITLGSDRPPGMTFSSRNEPSRLWVDPARNSPARSIRSDSMGRELAQLTGGHFLAIGTSQFDEYQIAQTWAGKHNPINFTKPSAPTRPYAFIVSSMLLFMTSEALYFLIHFRRVRSIQFLGVAILFPLISCSQPNASSILEIGLKQSADQFQNGNFFESEAILNQLRMDAPKEPVVLYDLALLKLSQQKPGDAIRLLNQSKTLFNRLNSYSPTHQRLACRIEASMGYAHILDRQWDASVKALETALQLAMELPDSDNREINHIRQNLDYARQSMQEMQSPHTQIEPAEKDARQLQPNPSSIAPETPFQEIHHVAESVRNRARMARSQWQPAGDEILQPAGPLRKIQRMDW